MAQFLSASAVSSEIEKIVKQTQRRLILISPYLKFASRLEEEIRTLSKNQKDIYVICREKKYLQENQWLQSLPNIRCCISKNLHAKCYINEQQGIVTSMNLYDYSQVNNYEMGILFTKEQDADLYSEVYKEVKHILELSNNEIYVSVKESRNKDHSPKISNVHHGYCIRTGVEIPFDMNKPMCRDAYYEWADWGNPDYRECFCHYSGEPSYGETSMAKPVLRKNYDAAIELQNKLHPDIISICRK